ncbi:putative Rho GTPase-activating protein gacGG [Glarea lozoyensis 74030]|uniref:Putative Rho GTPase-activating protein gacGG n=1 Tax=Glarea lozoyensis (strain ATCC 74030 / MF5533) TaxID=1104152 RepID=H0EME4_GLAL7|nr:putative Rho GTPase-activating protein gacGG [Glarea lozoyensis 74030]
MLPNFVLETPTSEEPYGAELWAFKTGSDTDYLANNKILSKLPDDLDYPIGQLCGMVREAWCTAFNTREVTIMAGNPPTIQYFDYLNPHTRTKKSDQETFPFSDVVQIVANATAFQALSSTGEVVSWGDSRYPQVLARPVTDQTPAKTPHPILSVRDLPTGRIRKISAGPYFTAGITTGNDLYIWGQPPPGPENEEEPNPINSLLDDDAVSIDCHGHDILDVACGKDCMLVLTVTLDAKMKMKSALQKYVESEGRKRQLEHEYQVLSVRVLVYFSLFTLVLPL